MCTIPLLIAHSQVFGSVTFRHKHLKSLTALILTPATYFLHLKTTNSPGTLLHICSIKLFVRLRFVVLITLTMNVTLTMLV